MQLAEERLLEDVSRELHCMEEIQGMIFGQLSWMRVFGSCVTAGVAFHDGDSGSGIWEALNGCCFVFL